MWPAIRLHRTGTDKISSRQRPRLKKFSCTCIRGNRNVFFVCEKPVFHPLKYNIGVRRWYWNEKIKTSS